jgi:hypothetical protein
MHCNLCKQINAICTNSTAPATISALASSKSTFIGRNRNDASERRKRMKNRIVPEPGFHRRSVRRNLPYPPHKMSKKSPG